MCTYVKDTQFSIIRLVFFKLLHLYPDIPQVGSPLMFNSTSSSLTTVWEIPLSPVPPESYSFFYSCSAVPFCYIQHQKTTPFYTQGTVYLNAPNYTIANLIPETLCEVSVSAVYNESLNEISVPVNASAYIYKGLHLPANGHNFTQCSQESDIIQGLDVDVINDTAVALFWIPVVPQCCVSYYVILYYPDSEAISMNGRQILATYPGQVLTGLISGEEYHFNVSAVLINGVEASPLSTSKLITTIAQNDLLCCNTIVNGAFTCMPPQASTTPTSSTFSFLVNDYVTISLAVLLFLSAIIILIFVIILCTCIKRKTSRTKCKLMERYKQHRVHQ